MGKDDFLDLDYGDEVFSQEEREYACSIHPEVYSGVHAEVVERMGVTFINYIWAKEEGSGQVGKYLDSLSGPVIVQSVVSSRFRGMLLRRGFKPYGDGNGMKKGI